MISGDSAPSEDIHGDRIKTLGFSSLNRGFITLLALSILGSGGALVGFLWTSLLIVEHKILAQAQHQDFPVMVDALTRPLDTTMDRLLQGALALSQERVLEEWAAGIEAGAFEYSRFLAPLIETGFRRADFDQMYVGLPEKREFWVYHRGVMRKATNLSINEERHRWMMDGLTQEEPYRFTFFQTPYGGDLWISIPIGSIHKPRGTFYLSLGAERLFHKLGQIPRLHHDSYYIAPDGHSLIENDTIRMWIIDRNGMVVLSDVYDDIGQSAYDLFPDDMITGFQDYLSRTDWVTHSHTVTWNDRTSEMIHYPTMSGAMEMIVTIPHDRVIGFLDDIRWYLTLACFIAGMVLTAGLAVVYLYVINPNRRIIQLNHELAVAVQEETGTLEKLANVDGLTGLHNRRYFDAVFASRHLSAEVQKEPLSVLFVDVDFFKKYNDLYGHRAGDACLRQVAEILDTNSHRMHDLVARYGGEEFVILLPDTPLAGALIIAERMRAAVEAVAIPHADSSVASVVTTSVGVATAVPGAGISTETLLERADAALYQAKATGRNRSTYLADI